ncbi:MAG: SUMF1/EgtB/PvdO family nonheme iron enzyme [Oligosphaeraceae bacterium]|nr:SUMF1/EgtB/PvdO family nonheme iron enzyme [Oligosphaeraceae bacterium]
MPDNERYIDTRNLDATRRIIALEDGILPPEGVDINPAVSATPENTLKEFGIDVKASGPDFSNMAEIGAGGVGIVQGATDPALGRLVAVKILRPEYRFSRDHIERMLREARATAQLEHPNIVPLHSLGLDKKYGVYFTMKYLQGDTLRNILRQIAEGNPPYLKEYSRAKLIIIFIKACQGVSYAHSKGVLHRDLKPENILVGKYGEVTVIDWGLVRRMNPLGQALDIGDDSGVERENRVSGQSIELDAKQKERNLTEDSFITGTPRYMAPEQAVGWNSKLDHRCDIYSMGVILYEILTGSNPFEHLRNDVEILQAVSAGEFTPPRQLRGIGKSISPEWEAICLKAMQVYPEQRYQTITDLIHDLYNVQAEREITSYRANWYQRLYKRIKRNPLKIAVLIGAAMAAMASIISVLLLDYANYRQNIILAKAYNERGKQSLQELAQLLEYQERLHYSQLLFTYTGYSEAANSKIEEKESAIITEYDQAYLLLTEMSAISRRFPEVISLQSKIIHDRLQFAMSYHRFAEIDRWLNLARKAYGENFANCPADLRSFLEQVVYFRQGNCELRIMTQPPGAAVSIHPIVENPAAKTLDVSSTPLPLPALSRASGRFQLSQGNYLLKFILPDRPEVLYPLKLQYGQNLQLEVFLPAKTPPGMAYIPAGSCLLGGAASLSTHPRQVELAGFFISISEVTFAEYLRFWLSLEEESQRYLHYSRVHLQPGSLSPREAWSPDGTLLEGLSPEMPVVGISAESAMAYCDWLSRELGLPCRLPNADEWEKAARGVDGRLYPWGNFFEPSFAFTRDNLEAVQKFGRWAQPRQFPRDVSIYGVYDLAGNVREWTASTFDDSMRSYQIKGSSGVSSQRFLPLSRAHDTPMVPSDVGFRVMTPLQL